MEFIPTLPKTKQYKTIAFHSGYEVVYVLRFEYIRNGGKRQSSPFVGRGRNYHAAKRAAWQEYFDTLQAVTCPVCNKWFASNWQYWQHMSWEYGGRSTFAYEHGEYECPEAFEITF